MQLSDRVAVITGGASGIARATCLGLAREEVRAIGVVDVSDDVFAACEAGNRTLGRDVLVPFKGDVSSTAFRQSVYAQMVQRFGPVHICVPAAGIVRDALAVKLDETGKAVLYDEHLFRKVIEINLLAPIYWAMEMIGTVAEDRARRKLGRWEPEEKVQGTIIFIGSISSAGNRGQVSYAATKAGLAGAQATLAKEAIYHGVRCAIIHPGFTDTPMVRAMDPKMVREKILPLTQLRRLLRPEEVADAILFMIRNSAASGALWVDAGWHPPA
ncbi:MAG: SDR family NAD(P)-dependent oxidoreductase [Phycisphaerales bacterium]|nr:SDR family NAD(P)-dependent oxidoreductase [Phycisphaerales bacterium]